jgi:hypothetical protein
LERQLDLRREVLINQKAQLHDDVWFRAALSARMRRATAEGGCAAQAL